MTSKQRKGSQTDYHLPLSTSEHVQETMAGLEATLAARLAQREASQRLRQLTTMPPDVVDFSSNDYLSLSSHRGLQRAFVRRFEALIGGDDGGDDENGPPPSRLLGSGGSANLPVTVTMTGARG